MTNDPKLRDLERESATVKLKIDQNDKEIDRLTEKLDDMGRERTKLSTIKTGLINDLARLQSAHDARLKEIQREEERSKK